MNTTVTDFCLYYYASLLEMKSTTINFTFHVYILCRQITRVRVQIVFKVFTIYYYYSSMLYKHNVMISLHCLHYLILLFLTYGGVILTH